MIGGFTYGYDSRYRRTHSHSIATVYSYKSENGGKWVVEPHTMVDATGYHVAIRVKPPQPSTRVEMKEL